MNQAQSAFSAEAISRLHRPQPDGRKRRLDRVGRAQMLPVCGREIVKGEQLLSIPGQARHRLRILCLVRGNAPSKCLLGMRSAVGLPDLVQCRFHRAMQRLRQFVQYIDRLVHPAALRTGRGRPRPGPPESPSRRPPQPVSAPPQRRGHANSATASSSSRWTPGNPLRWPESACCHAHRSRSALTGSEHADRPSAGAGHHTDKRIRRRV